MHFDPYSRFPEESEYEIQIELRPETSWVACVILGLWKVAD